MVKLCPYHQDSLGWDSCSEDFEGCEIEEVKMANYVYCKWCGTEAHPNDVYHHNEKVYCMHCWENWCETIESGGTPFSSAVPGRRLPNGARIILFEADPNEPRGVVLAMWEKNYGWEYICWLVDPYLGCSMGVYHRGTAEGLAAVLDKYKERVSRWNRRNAHA